MIVKDVMIDDPTRVLRLPAWHLVDLDEGLLDDRLCQINTKTSVQLQFLVAEHVL